jgi:hypothetical protein
MVVENIGSQSNGPEQDHGQSSSPNANERRHPSQQKYSPIDREIA